MGRQSDGRVNHVVVLNRTHDYKRFVKALIEEFQAEGATFNQDGGQSVEDQLTAAPAAIVDRYGFINAEGLKSSEAVQRFIAYFTGHLGMKEMCSQKAPAALEIGFGNRVEELACGAPGITIYHYSTPERQGAVPWRDLLRQRIAAGNLAEPASVFKYTTDMMDVPRYAEAWSLAKLLASMPAPFEQWLVAVRGGAEPMDAIQEHYQLDAAKLAEAWKKDAGRSR
jgi:hypothetical protein